MQNSNLAYFALRISITFIGPKGQGTLVFMLLSIHGEQGLDSDNNPVLECFGVPDVVLSATIVVCSTTVLYHAVITSFA